MFSTNIRESGGNMLQQEVKLARKLIEKQVEEFSKINSYDLIGARFKIGQEVQYIGNIEEYFGKYFRITGVSRISDLEADFEYSLENFPWLVFQYEIT